MSQLGETSLFADIVFWTIAVISVSAAVAVVWVRDIFRAALFLVLSFLTVAGFFVLLNAEFLAVVQVLIYVGAISILIIFAVLMTRDVQHGNLPNRLQIPAAIGAALFLAVLVLVAVKTDWKVLDGTNLSAAAGEKVAEVFSDTTPVIANLLLRDFVLPFEVASVMLLAAVIGALVLVRQVHQR